MGAADAFGALLSVWLGFFVVFALYRFGFFAERVLITLPGTSAPRVEKLRRTTGGARLRPSTEPRYLSAEEANAADDEVQPEDRVIDIDVDGYAIAYPLAAMSIRDIAHETFGDMHVFVSWWPVEYSARAFVIESDDEPSMSQLRKTLLNSSVLTNETGDLLVQFTGQTLNSDSDRLKQIPVVMTNWRAWSAAHPKTEVMSLEGAVEQDIFERYYVSNRSGLHQQSAHDRRWHDKDTTLGIELGDEAKAFPYPALIERPLLHEEIGGIPVLVLQERISATALAFRRDVKGKTLTFQPDSRNPRRPDNVAVATSDTPRSVHYEPWFLKDTQTGSRWRAITGECVSGELKGERLEMLPAQVGFWFAWSRFYPNARVLPPDSPPEKTDQ